MRLEQKRSVLFMINWSVLNVQLQLERYFISKTTGAAFHSAAFCWSGSGSSPVTDDRPDALQHICW